MLQQCFFLVSLMMFQLIVCTTQDYMCCSVGMNYSIIIVYYHCAHLILFLYFQEDNTTQVPEASEEMVSPAGRPRKGATPFHPSKKVSHQWRSPLHFPLRQTRCSCFLEIFVVLIRYQKNVLPGWTTMAVLDSWPMMDCSCLFWAYFLPSYLPIYALRHFSFGFGSLSTIMPKLSSSRRKVRVVEGQTILSGATGKPSSQ